MPSTKAIAPSDRRRLAEAVDRLIELYRFRSARGTLRSTHYS